MNGKGPINKWISIIHRKFQVYLNNELKSIDINSSEFMYLTLLSREGYVSLTYLTEKLSVDGAQTTRIIKKLVDRNLVKKIKDEHDKRGCILSLTEEGRKIIPVINSALKAWHETITEDLTKEEIKIFEEKLSIMAKKAIKKVEVLE